ncbi:PREDICTED: uncharacterized protein LOC106306894 isoform X2 [Brassica oleracea var. oleracea]|uniref:uncharacterized protein LOC106306894 isoform X2 n=1 Tax=Brassica oleracea var. oleracea TaxID=109376 RepID=UPI0006A7399C|nr:PREDICTED: uncharacterized protein LOC106306894 isoform X2 [Brassica oleracea var. oleracea]
MWWGEEAAKGAKIAVWWDMKECPIPEGYDAGRIRPSLEAAFKERGYSGPVASITAYGDQTQTPVHILQGLLSTGVSVAHTRSESTNYILYRDIVEWRGQNPPPATMMIISNQVGGDLSWDLARLQQRSQYNLFLAYSKAPCVLSVLSTSSRWLWEKLLGDNNNRIETRSVQYKLSAMILCCKSCNFDCQSPEKFRKHLSSYKHARQESVYPTYKEVNRVTETWGRNYAAAPEYATAKILVWWNMFDCPIPEGYDARRVRPSLEEAFKKLGYSGPVSITAYGDLNHTPEHLLRGLSSTGVSLAHTILDTHQAFSTPLVRLVQKQKHNLFLAYSSRPCKMFVLLPSAEWLWHSLLEVSEKRKHVLQKCTSESESDRGGESSAMLYCKVCCGGQGPDYKSLDYLRTHLSSEEHAQEEYSITAFVQLKTKNRNLSLLAQYDREHRQQWRQVKKSKNIKRIRKAFRTGFLLLYNHLRRLRARKSQSCRRRGSRRRAQKSPTVW